MFRAPLISGVMINLQLFYKHRHCWFMNSIKVFSYNSVLSHTSETSEHILSSENMAPSAIEVIPSEAYNTPSVKKVLADSRSAADIKITFGDFRDDLMRDGYAVVKGAIPRDRADVYGRAFYDFLESL